MPEIPLQDQPNIADNFAEDVLTYKIRHIDHRGFYGATVAGTRLRSDVGGSTSCWFGLQDWPIRGWLWAGPTGIRGQVA